MNLYVVSVHKHSWGVDLNSYISGVYSTRHDAIVAARREMMRKTDHDCKIVTVELNKSYEDSPPSEWVSISTETDIEKDHLRDLYHTY
jgi:hypothetical protein